MVDLLIKNGRYVVCDPGTILENGAVAIDEGRIVEVGSSGEVAKKYRADKVIDATGKAVMPGLINCHTHGAENLFKGLSDDRPLWEWYRRVIAPGQFFFTESNTYLFYLLTYADMIRGGTTCYLDQYFFPDVMCQAGKQSGLRANVAPFVFDAYPRDRWPNRFIDAKDPEEQLRNIELAIRKWHGAENGRLRLMFGIHTVIDNSVEHLQRTRELANKHGVGIHVHLNESMGEIKMSEDIHSKRSLEHANDVGILGPDVSAAHCCWLTDHEQQIIVERGVKVAHNPKTNMKIADGICPVPELLQRGATVGLGSDGAGSSGETDMFNAMKLAAILHKVNKLDATVMPAQKVFELATQGGAKLLQLENDVGTIERGKKADIIVVDIQKPRFFPLSKETIISNLVYTAHGGDVDTTIVDGKVLMENRRPITIDEEDTLERAQKEADKFISQLYPNLPGVREGVKGVDYW